MVEGCICSNLDSDGSKMAVTQPTDLGEGCHQVAENPVDFPQVSWPCRHQQVPWFCVPCPLPRSRPKGKQWDQPGHRRWASTAHTGAGEEGAALTLGV